MKYQVKRSTKISADFETVKALVNDFNKWNSWSPWIIVEPDCPVTVTGTPGQPGHEMKWDGKIIGSGKMNVTKCDDGKCEYDLEFLAPMKSKAETAFHLTKRDGEVEVTWTMDGNMPFYLFFLVPMMRSWIGMDYDRGLRMMKEIAEKGSVAAETKNAGVKDFEGFSYVGIKQTLAMDAMKEQMPKDFEKLIEEVVTKRNTSAQHWVTVYPKMNMKSGEFTYIAAVSDENLKDADLGPEFVRGEIPSSKALEITHHGSYDFLGNAWSMGMMYVMAKKMKQSGKPFEYYRNSPLETAPEDLETSVFFPVKA